MENFLKFKKKFAKKHFFLKKRKIFFFQKMKFLFIGVKNVFLSKIMCPLNCPFQKPDTFTCALE